MMEGEMGGTMINRNIFLFSVNCPPFSGSFRLFLFSAFQDTAFKGPATGTSMGGQILDAGLRTGRRRKASLKILRAFIEDEIRKLFRLNLLIPVPAVTRQ